MNPIDNTWKISIRNHPVTILKEVWVYRNLPDGRIEILQSDLDTIKTLDRYIPADADEKPTMLLHPDILHALVQEAEGMLPEEREYTEGKLEATENHLADLRQLLKLK